MKYSKDYQINGMGAFKLSKKLNLKKRNTLQPKLYQWFDNGRINGIKG